MGRRRGSTGSSNSGGNGKRRKPQVTWKVSRKKTQRINLNAVLKPAYEDAMQRFELNLPELNQRKARVLEFGGLDSDFALRLIQKSLGVIHAECIDESFSQKEFQHIVQENPDVYKKRSYEKTEYENNSFNLIVANRSVPLHSRSAGEAIRSLLEMVRICSKEGEIKIFPAYPLVFFSEKKFNNPQKIFDSLERAGYEIHFKTETKKSGAKLFETLSVEGQKINYPLQVLSIKNTGSLESLRNLLQAE